MSSLYYADEVKGTEELEDLKATQTKVPAEAIKLARQLIEGLHGPFEPEIYKDEYREQLLTIVQSRVEGREAVVAGAAPEPAKIVNLMEALKKSLAAGAAPAAGAKAAPAKQEPEKRARKRASR
jgi:DNA end-binding protein Ku